MLQNPWSRRNWLLSCQHEELHSPVKCEHFLNPQYKALSNGNEQMKKHLFKKTYAVQ
jgi:hypothetical protein